MRWYKSISLGVPFASLSLSIWFEEDVRIAADIGQCDNVAVIYWAWVSVRAGDLDASYHFVECDSMFTSVRGERTHHSSSLYEKKTFVSTVGSVTKWNWMFFYDKKLITYVYPNMSSNIWPLIKLSQDVCKCMATIAPFSVFAKRATDTTLVECIEW